MECTRCGSRSVIPDVQISDQGQYSDGKLKARVDKRPRALMFKGSIMCALRGRICGDCGHVELFVEAPERLYNAWREQQRGQ